MSEDWLERAVKAKRRNELEETIQEANADLDHAGVAYANRRQALRELIGKIAKPDTPAKDLERIGELIAECEEQLIRMGQSQQWIEQLVTEKESV